MVIESTVKPMRRLKFPNRSQSKPTLERPPSAAFTESRCASNTNQNSVKTLPMATMESQSPPRGSQRPRANSTTKAQAGMAGRIQACSSQSIYALGLSRERWAGDALPLTT